MAGLGCLFSVLAGLFALVGLVPFLGWFNWITTLPAAVLAIAFSAQGLSRGSSGLAVLGLIGGILVLFWALFRLTIGGGFI